MQAINTIAIAKMPGAFEFFKRTPFSLPFFINKSIILKSTTKQSRIRKFKYGLPVNVFI